MRLTGTLQAVFATQLIRRVRSKANNWFHAFAQGSKISYLQEQLKQLQISNDYLMALWMNTGPKHPNPLAHFGKKVFS